MMEGFNSCHIFISSQMEAVVNSKATGGVWVAAFTGRHLDHTQASTLVYEQFARKWTLDLDMEKYESTWKRWKSFDSYLTGKTVNGLDFRTRTRFLWHGVDLKLPVSGTLQERQRKQNGFALILIRINHRLADLWKMIFQQWMLWAFEIELLSSHSSTLTFLFYSCKNAWRLIRKHEILQSTFYQIKGERDTGNSQPLNGEWQTLWWREFGRETRHWIRTRNGLSNENDRRSDEESLNGLSNENDRRSDRT